MNKYVNVKNIAVICSIGVAFYVGEVVGAMRIRHELKQTRK